MEEVSIDVQPPLGGAPGLHVILRSPPDLSGRSLVSGHTAIINLSTLGIRPAPMAGAPGRTSNP